MSGAPEVLQRLRRAHTQAVLDELLREGALSRSELARRTGLSRTTLTTILTELLRRGALVEQPESSISRRGRGRPVMLVSLNPAAGLLLGVDLAQSWVHVAVVNMAHDVVATERVATAIDTTWSRRVDQTIRLIDRMAKDYGMSLETLEAIGLGMFGVIEDPMLPPGSGALTKAARQVMNRLEKRYGVRVVVDNTARLGALAEATWGSASGVDEVAYVRWSDGVGGGIIVGGQLVRGAHGIAAQLGHTSVDPDGPDCGSCGGRGCLDGRIRIPALLEAAADGGVDLADVNELMARARDGDSVVRDVLDNAARDLGVVLAGLVVHVDPARIVVGGELAQLGELVLERVRATVQALAMPTSQRRMEVVAATFGPEAGAMGAVALVLRDLAPRVRRRP